MSILGLFGLNFIIAYFCWISRKGDLTEESGIANSIILYWTILNILFFSFTILIFILMGWNETFWPDVPIWVIWLGVLWALFMYLFQFLTNLADGKAFSVELEKDKIGQNIFRVIALAILFFLGYLYLCIYFALQIALTGIGIGALSYWLLVRKGFSLHYLNLRLIDRTKTKEFLSYTITFIKPLLFITIFSVLIGMFDRWFLQLTGGAYEQGLYGIGFRLGSVVLLFTAAMTPILMREYGQAFQKKDFPALRKHFRKINLYFSFQRYIMGVLIYSK
jgi:O-antigen/teichoic acid export membrane protein